MKEELKVNLQAVITSMINEDPQAAEAHLREYLNTKTSDIINEADDEECDDDMEAGDDVEEKDEDDKEDKADKEEDKDE